MPDLLEILADGEAMKSPRYLMNRFLAKVYFSNMLPTGSNILEVGVGGNITNISLWGRGEYDYVCTDYHIGEKYEYTLPEARHLDILNMSDEDFIKEKPLWDLIIASQVLEHVPLPMDAVKSLYDHIKINGVLVLTVPFRYRIHDTDPETGIVELDMKDYWRFTPSGLSWLLQYAGFTEYSVGKVCDNKNDLMDPIVCIAIARRSPDVEYKPFQWDPYLPDDWFEQLEVWGEEYKAKIGR